MATARDLARIAASLPGAQAGDHPLDFAVALSAPAAPSGRAGKSARAAKPKGFVWAWRERVAPKQPRVPNAGVLAARVRDLDEKAALLATDPDVFFTEPHYNGFPAVLVRLAAIRAPALRAIVVGAWRCIAPAKVVAAFDAGGDATGAEYTAPRKRRR